MINILLVEDKKEKIKECTKVLEIFGLEKIVLDKANDINTAKKILKKKNIDIMILDIHLPQSFGDEIKKDGGIQLLEAIRKSRSFSYPKYVISVSEFEEGKVLFEEREGNIHKAIYYDPTNNKWENELFVCLETAIAILSNKIVHRVYDYDVAVICALREEVDIIKEILCDVNRVKVPYDQELYYDGYFMKDDRKVRVVLSSARQMGMVAATALATKMINNFTPRYLVMTGITGGTKPEKMDFGDIIVASRSWDYRAGKDIREGKSTKHLNSLNDYTADSKLIDYCRNIQDDIVALRSIKDSFKNGVKPKSELRMLIGPVVSGASVVTDPQIVDDVLQNQDRDVLGIEMEIYGIYYAAFWAIEPKPSFIAIKSVSDFADSDKGDTYHPYAAYTSAKAFEILAQQYLEYDD